MTSYRFLDDHLRRQFEEHVAGTGVLVRGPFVTLAREFERGRPLAELIQAGRLHPDLARARWLFGGGPLFSHQERVLEIARAGRSCVATTGTGSGKTEAFLLPILGGLLFALACIVLAGSLLILYLRRREIPVIGRRFGG